MQYIEHQRKGNTTLYANIDYVIVSIAGYQRTPQRKLPLRMTSDMTTQYEATDIAYMRQALALAQRAALSD